MNEVNPTRNHQGEGQDGEDFHLSGVHLFETYV